MLTVTRKSEKIDFDPLSVVICAFEEIENKNVNRDEKIWTGRNVENLSATIDYSSPSKFNPLHVDLICKVFLFLTASVIIMKHFVGVFWAHWFDRRTEKSLRRTAALRPVRNNRNCGNMLAQLLLKNQVHKLYRTARYFYNSLSGTYLRTSHLSGKSILITLDYIVGFFKMWHKRTSTCTLIVTFLYA